MQENSNYQEDNYALVNLGAESTKITVPKLILLVDDDFCLLQIAKKILEAEGLFIIDCVSSVDEAYQKLSMSHYDAIISDFEMPKKNGLTFLKELREKKNEIPFILFTGKSREEMAVKALKLGADGYITKQGNPETVYGELTYTLQNSIEKNESKQKLAESEMSLFSQKTIDSTPNLIHCKKALKALQCLDNISQIAEKQNVPLDEVLQKTNEMLPKIWQYSDVACSRIIFENKQYTSNGFKETVWKQQANILLFDRITGCVQVFYLEEKPTVSSEGPFLEDERIVIDIIAEHIGRIAKQKDHESRVRFQINLLNSVDQSVVMVDENRKIRFWNKASENLYGWSEKEVLGKDIIDVTGNGERLDSETIMQRLRSSSSVTSEISVICKDGTEVSVIVNRSPLFDDNGNYFGSVSVVTNISELKKMQRDLAIALEALSYTINNSELLNEKLRVVGSLTRHDVRNKLSVIAGYAYLLKKRHKDTPDIVEKLDQIEAAIRDIVGIFNFSKIYEQLGVEKLTVIDVGSTIDSATKLFSSTISFKIINECNGTCLLADSFLVQLFYNLLDNTRKYGQKVTEVKISCEIGLDGGLILIYEDNGVGISYGDKPFLFKEGHSTGDSTGLGLFFIKRMLDVYGWQIQETGEPGKGAKFVIHIPKGSVYKTPPKILCREQKFMTSQV